MPEQYKLTDFKVGDRITWWSERVFGVPCHGDVTKLGRKYITVDAWYGHITWTTRVHPGRVIEITERVA